MYSRWPGVFGMIGGRLLEQEIRVSQLIEPGPAFRTGNISQRVKKLVPSNRDPVLSRAFELSKDTPHLLKPFGFPLDAQPAFASRDADIERGFEFFEKCEVVREESRQHARALELQGLRFAHWGKPGVTRTRSNVPAEPSAPRAESNLNAHRNP